MAAIKMNTYETFMSNSFSFGRRHCGAGLIAGAVAAPGIGSAGRTMYCDRRSGLHLRAAIGIGVLFPIMRARVRIDRNTGNQIGRAHV